MSFAKCETGKMCCDYVEAINSSRHTLWTIWLHIHNVIKTRIISSSEKEENELMTCLMSIVVTKYIQDMRMYSSTSTFQ
jgi:hypothetical protein